jgi:hypothetical protein
MTVRGALTVVGQVAGSYFGPVGAAIGGFVGSQVGLLIEGPQQVQGPRLDDLKVAGSSYGTPIAYIEGHPRVAGSIIWASTKREIATTTEVGGKGAPEAEQTTYTYVIDMLVLLSSREIAGVSRIWSNSKLVWSVLTDDAATNSAQLEHWAEMIVYTGDAAQLPDPTYEADVGVGNAPAYRGRGVVMLRSLNLGGGGQIPNLTFEVFTSGTPHVPGYADDFSAGLAPWTVTLGGIDGFSEQVGPYGPIIQSEGRVKTGGVSDEIAKVFPSQTVRELLIKFQCTSDGGDDDSGVFSIDDGVTTRFVFVARREAAVDAARRPTVTIAGVGQTIGTVAVDLDVWYQLQVTIVIGGGNTHVKITNIATGVVFLDVALALSYSPFTADRIRFTNDSTNASPATRETQFADFVLPGTAAVITDELLPDVVERLCLRAGLTAPQVDVSLLPAEVVLGLPVGQVSTTRQVLEILAAAYLFESVESGAVIKFVPRGGASVVTIPYDQMGASTGGPIEPLPVSRRNDDEAPALCVVRYSNADNDYQDGSETSDRLTGSGTGVRVVELPLVLTPTAAKRLADVYIHDVSVSDLALGPVAVNRDYAVLEPTDVVLLTDVDGSTYRARITKFTDSGGVRSFDAVIDDASVITSAGTTSGGYESSTTIVAPVDTLLYLLDIPILRDADDASGVYAAARGVAAPWPGAAVLDSPDAVEYTELVRVLESAVAGVCLTTLGAWTRGRVFDEVNTVRVSLALGTAASVSRETLLGDQTVNAWLIGSEILQARDATLVSAGVYDLSGLLRGGRGTEWAMGGHVAGERCVKLQLAGLRRVPVDTSRIGLDRYYKGVTLGRAIGTAPAQTFADTGVDRKPFSPFDARVARDGSNNCTITWQRRSRLAVRTTGPAGISIPLGEETEAYLVDVYDDGTYTTLLRTISASTPSASYTAAEQTTDGLTPGDPLFVHITQVSAVVGRGYALEATA